VTGFIRYRIKINVTTNRRKAKINPKLFGGRNLRNFLGCWLILIGDVATSVGNEGLNHSYLDFVT
jgi:hypothetical protein